MTVHSSYTDARAHLAELWDRVTEDRETVIISRRGAPDVALISADELTSLQETAYLFRSPTNAERLLVALQRAIAGTEKPQTVEDLKRELGLAEG